MPGRAEAMRVPAKHFVNGHALKAPFPEGMQLAQFGLGCFWGAERVFWETPGVYSTAVGYAGGETKNPTYEEVCSGFTNHTEAVLVVFDPKVVTYEELLKVFWEAHDPTQGMRQGNDTGSQYRSAIYTYGDAQAKAARGFARGVSTISEEPRASARSRPRSVPRRSSIMPRTITSSTSARIPAATAAWAAPGFRVRREWRSAVASRVSIPQGAPGTLRTGWRLD